LSKIKKKKKKEIELG